MLIRATSIAACTAIATSCGMDRAARTRGDESLWSTSGYASNGVLRTAPASRHTRDAALKATSGRRAKVATWHSTRPALVSATGDYEPRDPRRTKTPRRPYRPSPVILRWEHRRSRGDGLRAAASVFPRGESEPGGEISGGLVNVLRRLRQAAPGAIICAYWEVRRAAQ
jgi:hypothetical protein